MCSRPAQGRRARAGRADRGARRRHADLRRRRAARRWSRARTSARRWRRATRWALELDRRASLHSSTREGRVLGARRSRSRSAHGRAARVELVILHLGLGSFHRAHQAVYLQRLIERGDRAGRSPAATCGPTWPRPIAALQRAGRRVHARDRLARGRAPLRAHHARSARCVPYEPSLAGLIAHRRRRRARASSRSPSPRPATTSTRKTGSTLSFAELAADLERARAGRAGQHDLRRARRDPARAHARATPAR